MLDDQERQPMHLPPLALPNRAGDPAVEDVLRGWRERVRQWRRETQDPFSEFMG